MLAVEIGDPLTPAQFALRELGGLYVGDVDIDAARAAREAQRQCAVEGKTTLPWSVVCSRVDYHSDPDFERAYVRVRAGRACHDERIVVACDEAAYAVDCARRRHCDHGQIPVVATAWAHRALQMAGARVVVEAAPSGEDTANAPARIHAGGDDAAREILWHRGQAEPDGCFWLSRDAHRDLIEHGSTMVKLDDGRVAHVTATIYSPPSEETSQ